MTWLWIGVGGIVLVAGALVPVLSHRRRGAAGAEIRARAAYLELAHHVEVPPPVPHGDEHAGPLLRHATERWHSAGAVLASASTPEEFRLAEDIAGEGLTAVREALARLA